MEAGDCREVRGGSGGMVLENKGRLGFVEANLRWMESC